MEWRPPDATPSTELPHLRCRAEFPCRTVRNHFGTATNLENAVAVQMTGKLESPSLIIILIDVVSEPTYVANINSVGRNHGGTNVCTEPRFMDGTRLCLDCVLRSKG